jgi:purine-binding chemotaxis protein CheW
VRRGGALLELASAPEATPAGALAELCAFRVGDEEYAIDLRRVREILQPLPITAVPRAPEFLDGMIDVRGEVIPVIDVRRRLGLPARTTPRHKVLVVNVAGRVLGLVVDAVIEVMRLPRAAIGPPPLAPGGGAQLYLGVCSARERPGVRAAQRKLRLLLNVKALLAPGTPELAAQARAQGGSPGRA